MADHIDDQRADVAFIYGNKKIAVEIETGKNKDKQVEKKVDWLNKHFNHWVIVASKNIRGKYTRHANHKGSVLSVSKADKKIKALRQELVRC